MSQLTKEYVTGAEIWIYNLATKRIDFSYTSYTHRFGSAKHLGEDPAGEWTLRISDADEGSTGTLHSWSIKVYGNRSGDTVPTFGSETITDKEYYATVTAVTETLPEATGGDGTLRYSLRPALPAGLNFNETTREINGTPTTATSKTTYTYTATDYDGDTDELTFGITVGADMPTFGSETITDKEYVTGTAITETLLEAAGGNAPLRYSLILALPAGLNFNETTQEINGTPTTATSKTTYTYTATDYDGDTDELTFGITVIKAELDTVPTFGGETITDKEYLTRDTVTETLPEAAGGNLPLTYSLNKPLPDGLDFDSNTREITGTPTAAMPETVYTYTAVDNDGDTAELTFRITVEEDIMPDFDSTTVPSQMVYTARRPLTLLAATGGNGTLTYSLDLALPSGLSFDSNTRVISGTPTSASSGTYTYTVTDRNGNTAERSFMLSVTGPPDRRPPTDTEGSGGCAISDQNDIVSDLLGVMACLMLIPLSVVIRRKRRYQIKTGPFKGT